LNRSGQNDPLSSVLYVGPEGPTPYVAAMKRKQIPSDRAGICDHTARKRRERVRDDNRRG
jgi:hypothetical protein